MNHYTFRASWSAEYREYVGECVEIRSLSRQAPTAQEAIAAVVRAADELVAELQACSEQIPTPLVERQYSGNFAVRTSPALHARLATEAAEQGVSMNQWVVQKLAGRPLNDLFDW